MFTNEAGAVNRTDSDAVRGGGSRASLVGMHEAAAPEGSQATAPRSDVGHPQDPATRPERNRNTRALQLDTNGHRGVIRQSRRGTSSRVWADERLRERWSIRLNARDRLKPGIGLNRVVVLKNAIDEVKREEKMKKNRTNSETPLLPPVWGVWGPRGAGPGRGFLPVLSAGRFRVSFSWIDGAGGGFIIAVD